MNTLNFYWPKLRYATLRHTSHVTSCTSHQVKSGYVQFSSFKLLREIHSSLDAVVSCSVRIAGEWHQHSHPDKRTWIQRFHSMKKQIALISIKISFVPLHTIKFKIGQVPNYCHVSKYRGENSS